MCSPAGISGFTSLTIDSALMLGWSPTPVLSASASAGAKSVAAASDIFSSLGTGAPVASPGCSKTRVEDGQLRKNNNESYHLQQ
jgi:hypothetical protein